MVTSELMKTETKHFRGLLELFEFTEATKADANIIFKRAFETYSPQTTGSVKGRKVLGLAVIFLASKRAFAATGNENDLRTLDEIEDATYISRHEIGSMAVDMTRRLQLKIPSVPGIYYARREVRLLRTRTETSEEVEILAVQKLGEAKRAGREFSGNHRFVAVQALYQASEELDQKIDLTLLRQMARRDSIKPSILRKDLSKHSKE